MVRIVQVRSGVADGVALRPPLFPETAQKEQPRAWGPEAPGLLAARGAARCGGRPLVEGVGGHDAALALDRPPEHGLFEDRLRLGVEGACADSGVLGPPRNQAPAERRKAPQPRVVPRARSPRARSPGARRSSGARKARGGRPPRRRRAGGRCPRRDGWRRNDHTSARTLPIGAPASRRQSPSWERPTRAQFADAVDRVDGTGLAEVVGARLALHLQGRVRDIEALCRQTPSPVRRRPGPPRGSGARRARRGPKAPCTSLDRLQQCRSWTAVTPFVAEIAAASAATSRSGGVDSSRTSRLACTSRQALAPMSSVIEEGGDGSRASKRPVREDHRPRHDHADGGRRRRP